MRRVRSQFPRAVFRPGLVVRMAVAAAALAAVAVPTSPAAAEVEERGFEMVSPDFMNGGARVYPVSISPDANRVIFSSASAFAGAEGLANTGGWYQAVRTPAGWETTAMMPGGAELPGYQAAGARSADMLRTLWTVWPAADWGTKVQRLMLRQDDGHGKGTWTYAAPRTPESFAAASVSGPFQVAATAEDLGATVLALRADRGIVNDGSTDTRTATSNSVYSLVRVEPRGDGSFEVVQVAKRNDGTTIAPTCQVRVGGGNATTTTRGAADPSLSRVVIGVTGTGATTCALPADSRVWVWIRHQGIVDVSESICTTGCGAAKVVNFEGGARDVRRVYFTTAQKLTDGNSSSGTDAQIADLYEYDFERIGQRLVPVTPEVNPSGTAGSGVNRVARVSPDGSRAYFVANGRALTGANERGLSPTPGGRNLYVYHRPAGAAQGSIAFVATLATSDSVIWGQDAQRKVETGRADGRYLYFVSRARLTDDEDPADTQPDIFRYDAQTERLQRVWRPAAEYNGANRTAGATFFTRSTTSNQASAESQRNPIISADGERIFFETEQRLDPADVNDQQDAYLWDGRDESVELISDGRGANPAISGAITPDGESFLFGTSTPLVPQHTSVLNAIYVSRPGGGFAPPPAPPEPCSGDGCQGPGSAAPQLPAAGSVDFSGEGNVRSPGTLTDPVVVSSKPVAGRTARLRVSVPGAGRITVAGASIRGASESASKRGSYSVKIALSARATKRLKKNKKLTVAVRVTYRAQDGRSASTRATVTFKQPKPKRSKAKGGGR